MPAPPSLASLFGPSAPVSVPCVTSLVASFCVVTSFPASFAPPSSVGLELLQAEISPRNSQARKAFMDSILHEQNRKRWWLTRWAVTYEKLHPQYEAERPHPSREWRAHFIRPLRGRRGSARSARARLGQALRLARRHGLPR